MFCLENINIYMLLLLEVLKPCYSTASLSIAAVKPPKIVKPTKDTVAPAQGPAVFTAKITGFPQPDVTWLVCDKHVSMC